MEKHKILLSFALGIIATVFVWLLYRMVRPFVAGASEIFFTGFGVGIIVGILVSVWIVRKIEPKDNEPKISGAK